MESHQYHQFVSSDNNSHEECRTMTQPGKACISFDFDFTIDYHRPWKHLTHMFSFCRYEEGVGIWPLQHPGAAAVNPAYGHWDKMYEHMTQKWCWFIHVFLHDLYLITTNIPVSQLNKEITDIKLHLERVSNGGKTSSSNSGKKKSFRSVHTDEAI